MGVRKKSEEQNLEERERKVISLKSLLRITWSRKLKPAI